MRRTTTLWMGLLAGLFLALPLQAQSLSPTVTNVTSSSFTISWATSQPLNTQVLYGTTSPSIALNDWTLTTAHTMTVSGLQPATAYKVEAESTYYTTTEESSPVLTVTTLADSGGSSSSAPSSDLGTPVISNITTSGFTIRWITNQPLNSQVHYGIGSASGAVHNWTLTTNHEMVVTGLQPGKAYDVQAESSYFSNPDLFGPVQTVTTATSGTPTPAPTPTPTPNPAPNGLGTPVISNVTSNGFTLHWTTTQPLNSQVHYGIGSGSAVMHNWALTTDHMMAVTGLQPGTTYQVQAESSYFSNPDLFGPVQTVTTTTGGTPTPPPTPTPTPTLSTPAVSNVTSYSFTLSWTSSVPLNSVVRYGTSGLTSTATNALLVTSHRVTVSNLQPNTTYQVQAQSSSSTIAAVIGPLQSVTTGNASSPAPSNRIFTGSAADWLYSPPTGNGINISGTTSNINFHVNTHDGGFDYPVEYTDGTHGCTNFTDTGHWNFNDHYCVPNPANGYHPSVGGWGANDGHLVVIDTATNTYYDFWKLLANASGVPSSTNVGQLSSGSLATSSGVPGGTAADITGLAGDILPGELNCTTCLQHALQVVVPGNLNSNLVGHQAPAQKTDGSVSGAIFREGAKIRFDPSINVDSLPVSTAVKAIMKALQNYGGVITDQTGGSAIAFYSALPTQPDLTGINLIGQHLLIYY